MNDVAARPNSLPWPPIIYLAAIAVSVMLNVFYPLPRFGQPLSGILFVLGWLMIAAFVALNISAIRAMRRAGTNDCEAGSRYRSPRHGRPFSFTRNPLYVAGTTLVLGIELVSGMCGFCSLRSSSHSQCKSSPSSGRKDIYKRDSGRPIWVMPVACGDGFS